jgi:energy-coupling factor transporter ATP-binding protein EcfA2
LIEIRNFSKAYDATLAVDDLTVSIQSGEILGLIGRNRVGKTTTMRALRGIIPFGSGDFIVDGFSFRFASHCWKSSDGRRTSPMTPDCLVISVFSSILSFRLVAMELRNPLVRSVCFWKYLSLSRNGIVQPRHCREACVRS